MPVPNDIERVKRNLVREEVYSTLKEWIVEGTLEPGEKVRDLDLARALGTSRTPIREALRRLEDEGLVETALNRWTRVASLDIEEAGQIYPIIAGLEALAMRLAGPRLEPSDLSDMRLANARLERALARHDAVGASRADRSFHETFVRRSANPYITGLLDDLCAKLRRLEVTYFGGSIAAERSVGEHREIITAMEAGDFELAARLVQANWENSLRRALESQARSEEAGASCQQTEEA